MNFKFEDLVSAIIKEIYVVDNFIVIFVSSQGIIYEMRGCGDCCAIQELTDISGNLFDLLGNPILLAEESRSDDSATGSDLWVFYKISTIKENVTMRWEYSDGHGWGGYSSDVALNILSEDEFKKIINKHLHGDIKKYL